MNAYKTNLKRTKLIINIEGTKEKVKHVMNEIYVCMCADKTEHACMKRKTNNSFKVSSSNFLPT